MAGIVWMLAENHSENADGRSLSHGRRTHVTSRRLCAARDEVDAELGHRHRFFQSMSQMKKVMDAHQSIFILQPWLLIQTPQIQNAVRQCIGTQCGKELLPIRWFIRTNGEVLFLRCILFTAVHNAAGRACCGQLIDQLLSKIGFVSKNQPGMRHRCLKGLCFRRGGAVGCGSFPSEDTDLPFTTVGSMQTGQRNGLRESALFQCVLPLRALHQGLLRAQVAIRQVPPAARETENRFRPQLRSRDVHEHQSPTRDQQFVQHLQRRAHISNGVEHVRADDEIVGVRFKALIQT